MMGGCCGLQDAVHSVAAATSSCDIVATATTMWAVNDVPRGSRTQGSRGREGHQMPTQQQRQSESASTAGVWVNFVRSIL